MKNQSYGDLDESKLIEGLTGERAIYKRRGEKEPEVSTSSAAIFWVRSQWIICHGLTVDSKTIKISNTVHKQVEYFCQLQKGDSKY